MTEREHAIHVQQQMVGDMNLTGHGGKLGWHHPGFRDPTTREPLTLGQLFDRYSTCLCVLDEKGAI